MKIAIIGYGKMGKAIERLAQPQHAVILRIGRHNIDELTIEDLSKADVAIEFSRPETAYKNIVTCLEAGVPVISGTTGWLEKKEEIHSLCKKLKGTFFYASNFSIGVNLFFALNEQLAKMMASFPEYKANLEEIHHIHKLDAPSGTAITLAEGLIKHQEQYSQWQLKPSDQPSDLPIEAHREGEVPGTHLVHYRSELDKITIRHEAFTRDSFAQGALLAATWVQGKKGIFSMKDLMQDL